MTKKYEKTNVPNMVIDKTTNTVLNTDQGGYEAIKRAREDQKKAQAMVETIQDFEYRIKELEYLTSVLERKIDELQDEIWSLRNTG